MKTPTQDQMDALKMFASANGRTWKSQLRQCWATGNYNAALGNADAEALQQVRNQFGPSWLVSFRLSEDRVTIVTDEYERSHGKSPRGRGSWAFTFDRMTYSDVNEVFFTPSCTWGEAKKYARDEARRRGAEYASAQP